MAKSPSSQPKRVRLTQKMKLHGGAFKVVYDGKTRASAGVLTVFAIPNQLPYSRLGLSVPRGNGTAVRRNLIKRRLRDAFRLSQHDLPRGYDLAIRVRMHQPRTVAEYAVWLAEATQKLHRTWQKRTHND